MNEQPNLLLVIVVLLLMALVADTAVRKEQSLFRLLLRALGE